MSSRVSPVVYRVGGQAVRTLVGGVAAFMLLMTLVGLIDATGTYASHLCGWPARISCHEPVAIWWLVPLGYLVMVVAGSAALAGWVVTGRNGAVACLTPAWAFGFLWLILAMGPRKFGLDDLLVIGLAGGLGIEVLRRTAVAWFPHRRPLVRRLAITTWLLSGATLFAVPYLLASAAERAGPS